MANTYFQCYVHLVFAVKRRDCSNYIKKQPEHHKKKSFREEYFHILEKFEIEFDEQYLFEWID